MSMVEQHVMLGATTLEVLRLAMDHPAEASAARPAVVLLHEGLGCVAMWKELPAALAEDLELEVVAYSRAGYGGSSKVAAEARPLSYLGREGVAELGHMLDVLGLRDVILVGHSDGASIALGYAASAASAGRLRGVVAMAPHTFVEELTLASIRQAREEYLHGPLRDKLMRYHGDNVDGAFWGWNGMWLDPAFRVAELDGALGAVTVPVLAIQGRDDHYGSLRQLEVLAERCRGPVEQLVLEQCGHSPHRDRPEATRAAIVAFARRLFE